MWGCAGDIGPGHQEFVITKLHGRRQACKHKHGLREKHTSRALGPSRQHVALCQCAMGAMGGCIATAHLLGYKNAGTVLALQVQQGKTVQHMLPCREFVTMIV